MKKNNITSFEIDIAKWYSDLILQSNLISYGPVKGTMFFKPFGYAIWSNIQKELDKKFKKLNIENVYFPLLFPESFLKKEQENFAGFAPEVLKVTEVGDKKLNENYIIRPTSETLFGMYFKENLYSYKELPIFLNQWVNIMRWENNTRPFLRNSEFLWQEGHTVHENSKEAFNFSKKIHKLYVNFIKNFLLLPIFAGEKTKKERFAGAEITNSVEIILRDGQALQAGTSHYLGQNFTKAFNVKISSRNNEMFYPFQTSWGVSTRLIGALVMTHSDNKGLRLPSKISPYNIMIITLLDKRDKSNNLILDIANKIEKELKGFRVKIDNSDKGIGYKLQEWEVKGIPLRMVIGSNEIKEKKIKIFSRVDYSSKDGLDINIKNAFVSDDKNLRIIDIVDKKKIRKKLSEYDNQLRKEARDLKDTKQVVISSIKEIKEVVENNKYAIAYWNENSKIEEEIKKNCGATIRVLINDKKKGISITDGKPTNILAIFARAY